MEDPPDFVCYAFGCSEHEHVALEYYDPPCDSDSGGYSSIYWIGIYLQNRIANSFDADVCRNSVQ